MSDFSDLTDALDGLSNTVDLLSLHELTDALNDHSTALDRHSAILEKMHETALKDKTAAIDAIRILGPL